MNEISVGGCYRAVRAKSGESTRGPWELLATKDDNGKCEINVWVNNKPSGVPTNGKFTVTKITRVSFKWKSETYQGNERWNPKIDIDADVRAVDEGLGNVEIDGINDDFGELGDNPFDDGLPL